MKPRLFDNIYGIEKILTKKEQEALDVFNVLPKSIETLTPQEYKVFFHRLITRLSLKDVAEVTGLKLKDVFKLMSNINAKLKQYRTRRENENA